MFIHMKRDDNNINVRLALEVRLLYIDKVDLKYKRKYGVIIIMKFMAIKCTRSV